MSMTKAERLRIERLETLENDVKNGRILNYEGLEFICKAYNYDAEKIGKHFLECYWSMKRKEKQNEYL